MRKRNRLAANPKAGSATEAIGDEPMLAHLVARHGVPRRPTNTCFPGECTPGLIGDQASVGARSFCRIGIVAETPAKAIPLKKYLATSGFQLVLGETDLANGISFSCQPDIVLVVGEQPTASFASALGMQINALNANTTIIIFDKMDNNSTNTLRWLGFHNFIHKNSMFYGLIDLMGSINPRLRNCAETANELRARSISRIFQTVSEIFDHAKTGGGAIDTNPSRMAEEAFDGVLRVTPPGHFAELLSAHHNGTVQHCALVSSIALKFAHTLGLASRDRSRVFDAAFFHDIGKAQVPLSILDKPCALSSSEWQTMILHTTHGYRLLLGGNGISEEVASAALNHHEYLDGTGYPHGIKGHHIGDIVRILTIADIFGALIEKRAYKSPKPPDEAYSIMRKMDMKLDQDLVREFSSVVSDFDHVIFA